MTDMIDMNSEGLEKQLGINIAKRRKLLGWTQEFVANSISVEVETISRMERGVTAPSLKTLAKLAALLGTNVSDLLKADIDKKTLSDYEGLLLMLNTLHSDDKSYVLTSTESLIRYFVKLRQQ